MSIYIWKYECTNYSLIYIQNMEKMLDSLEGKMEDILKKAEEIGHSEESSFSAADENK